MRPPALSLAQVEIGIYKKLPYLKPAVEEIPFMLSKTQCIYYVGEGLLFSLSFDLLKIRPKNLKDGESREQKPKQHQATISYRRLSYRDRLQRRTNK